MRTISPKQKRALEDLSAEGLLKGLPVQTAEKDVHITDLLRALSELKVAHGHFRDLDPRAGEYTRWDEGIRLVFAGGTCLSKAHGLINRMSEDVDIKVVLTPTPSPLKKGRGDRSRLIALHDMLEPMLTSLGFPLLRYANGAHNPNIKNSHKYYVVGAGYKSSYDQLPSLRPELKLELNHRNPLLPVEKKEFGYLYESLAETGGASLLSIDCISVAETAAEKVISLLRRCAYSWDGFQTKGVLDGALVRHVYDVAKIAEQHSASLNAARDIFPQLILNDQADYKNQHPGFDCEPVTVLRRTLVAAKANGELQTQYARTLVPLVYDTSPLTFEQAFKSFEEVAEHFLSACRSSSGT